MGNLSNLPKMTSEVLERAREARKVKTEETKKLYKTEYAEDDLWQALAKAKGVKLPSKLKKPTSNALMKFARSIGLADGTWEEALFGEDYKQSLKKAFTLQQKRLGEGNYETLRAMCGYMLETFC